MQRTQIYLSEKERNTLSSLSISNSKSISELIREAVDHFYFDRKKIDFAQTICYVKGIWKDRNDIKSAENYVRKLRVDLRPK